MTDRAYARISLDTLASGSIGKQRARLLKAAPEAVFSADESVSGSKVPFAERPEGARLLADLEKGDRVLVTKIDRAARNVRDLLALIERIEGLGASIVFVDQAIDTAGPMGRFLLILLGAVAELEAGIIAERRRESLEAFRQEGRWAVGSAPYGLQSVPNPNGRGLVLRPDPERAPGLRAAVEGILAGGTQRAAARTLGMTETALSRLLRNDRLAGVVGHGPDGPRLDEAQAIFSLVEWGRLQEFLKRPSKAWSKAEGIAAVLVCGVCGERLYYQRAAIEAHSTYRCRKALHAPGKPFAGQPSAAITVGLAETRVYTEFLDLFGAWPVTEVVEVGSDVERAEALALARLRLDAARRAQDAAQDDEAEEAADKAYRAARRALRDAEALPATTQSVEVETGETFAQAWERAEVAERVAWLKRVGPWVVAPGRLPVAEKVRRAEAGAALEWHDPTD
jgi:DNA invertase Pin-like site-specific DNA recombinase